MAAAGVGATTVSCSANVTLEEEVASAAGTDAASVAAGVVAWRDSLHTERGEGGARAEWSASAHASINPSSFFID